VYFCINFDKGFDEMKTPNRHSELIKAWADGAEIQFYDVLTESWKDCKGEIFLWHATNSYRLKPEPKPDTFVYPETVHSFEQNRKLIWYVKDELQLIFDGGTGQLKAAKVLK
jgi:hypothetical protein